MATADAPAQRRTLHGWSLRWDVGRAAAARADGWWVDDTAAIAAARAAEREPGRILVADPVRSLDAATLYDEAGTLSRALIARGLKPGMVVSFMLPNWHEAAVIYLAATMAGLVAHPIVPALRDREVAFMLADIGSRMVFVPERFREHDYVAMLQGINATLVAPPEVVVLRGARDGATAYVDLLAEDHADVALPPVDADAVKLVLYTSGTTGRPKGVIHTHNSIHALVRQIERHWHVAPDDTFFVPSPISHIGGSIYAFEMPLLCGTRAILQDRWCADEAVAIIARERCTHMAGATPFLEQLLAAARAAGERLTSLKLFICGGASVPPSLIRDAASYFHGCIVSRVFGSTEVPVATVGAMAPGDLAHAADTDGQIGVAAVRVVGPEGTGGADEGEIRARGPQMLLGYLWTEDERNAFDAEGFFRTGDLGRIVDGDFLVVTGRAKDIIIRQGENIAPKEIEDLLATHPDVAEIAIVGVPDARTGERACAVIVARGEACPDLPAIAAYLDERRVARFKIPEHLERWDALPRNVAGKVLKHQIRARLIAGMTGGGLTNVEFGWNEAERAHRARVRAVLDRELPEDWAGIAIHGPGSDAQTDFSRTFCKALDAEGLLIPHWPAAHGGEDLDVWRQFILGEEVWAAGEPRGPQYMNVNWVGPVMMRYGTEAQRARFLPPIRAGEAIWCQGFSEPSAGSDLAALRTSASPVDGGYRVTGAKIWTSYAGRADTCFLLARIPPREGGTAGKAGIVILLVDMRSPGIQVKRIPALIGEGDIHELFFDDVFVPDRDRLGEEGQAWEIINFALQNERVGIPRYEFSRRTLDRAVATLRREGRWDDPVVQDRAARALMTCEAARMLVYRVVDGKAHGAAPDAAGALARVAVVRADNAVNDFLTEFLPAGLLGADPLQQAHHQRAIAAGIASGATEIQLNLAAQRWLGLPREPRA